MDEWIDQNTDMKSIGMQYDIITIIKYHLLQLLIYYHTIVYHNYLL